MNIEIQILHFIDCWEFSIAPQYPYFTPSGTSSGCDLRSSEVMFINNLQLLQSHVVCLFSRPLCLYRIQRTTK